MKEQKSQLDQNDQKEIDDAVAAINSGKSGNFARRLLGFCLGLIGHSFLALLLGMSSFALLAMAALIFPIVAPVVYLGAYVGGTNAEANRND